MTDPRHRAEAALHAHWPHAGSLQPLGAGLDNTAFRAGELVVRVAADHDVEAEAGLLRLLAPRLGVAVPEPVFVDAEQGVLAYRLLPGTPLLGREPPLGSAARLGTILRALHAIPVDEVSALVPREDADPALWLEDLTGPEALVEIVRAAVPDPGPVTALCHADLGTEHLLADDHGLTGIIDWTDAAITDPALDFARLYRDFGPAFLEAALAAYGGLPGAMPRIRFYARCAALEDLAYGAETGKEAYAANARRSFRWLFPEIGFSSR